MEQLLALSLGDFSDSEQGKDLRQIAVQAVDILRRPLDDEAGTTIRNRIASIRLIQDGMQQLFCREGVVVFEEQHAVIRSIWNALYEKDAALCATVDWQSGEAEASAPWQPYSEEFARFLDGTGD